eukprot:TRINITY_DN75_c0_g1_i3.p1 TRINITY_DN75_c0_g1~~TRINITY_DN75_c0_g1_i3.p1  ORF type:complete len:691 (-),score=141.30 TRINITY_DN75_c0_g1_i3:170-2242(-)
MIRRPPRSTLSSSSAASDVYKRQYQRRVRGIAHSSMENFVLSFNQFREANGDQSLALGAASMIGLVLVASFRQRIDQAAVRHFVVSSTQKVDQVALRWKEIDETNAAARPIWAVMVCTLLLSLAHGHYTETPPVALLYALLIVPLAVCTATMSSLSWVNPVAQLAFLAARLWIQDQPGSALSNCWLPFVLANFCWIELSLQSLSTTVMSHLGTALVLAVFNKFSTAPALLSLLALGFFCYRRAHPTQTKSSQMHDVVKQCSDLVCLVLQSGDELSEDTQDTLAQILTLTKVSKNIQAGGGAASSGAGSGVGTGGGTEAPSEDDLFADTDLLQLLEEGEDIGMEDLFSPRASAAGEPCDNSAWKWLLDTFSEDMAEMDADGDSDSLSASNKRVREDECDVYPAPAVENWLAPLLEPLAMMNFDAMAVQDSGGDLMWANPAFKELACLAGAGDFGVGVSLLRRQFLQQPSFEQQRVHSNIQTASGNLDLWSCSKLVGSAQDSRTLWVLGHPVISGATLSGGTGSQDVEVWSGSSPAASVSELPMAAPDAEFKDIQIKVMCNASDNPQGPRVQNMWRKYGHKPLKPGTGPYGDSRVLDRLYYKCYDKNCKARLLVDLVKETQEQIHVNAKGKHNHDVPVLRVSMQTTEHHPMPSTPPTHNQTGQSTYNGTPKTGLVPLQGIRVRRSSVVDTRE